MSKMICPVAKSGECFDICVHAKEHDKITEELME